MASLVLLKKPTLMSSRRTLVALASLIEGFPRQPSISKGFSSDLSGEAQGFLPFSSCSGGLRNFHTGFCGRLDFRATFASQAGFAFADYSDEEKSKSGVDDEGKLLISKLGIHQDIVTALAKKGITKLFPIQRAVLEPAMQGRDMIGRARTGTGKTLAFGIPIMDKVMRYNAEHGLGRNPLALVLAPTRELAKQVEREFYDSAPNLETLCVYGGTPINQQMSSLDRGVDVIVGTPGRVIDLLKRGALDLSEVQFVVLDEADQMLNVGFEEAVEVILEKLPRKRQSMMFSATMPSWILKLTRKYLTDPLTIDLVGDSTQKLADGIKLYAAVTEHNMRAAVIGPLVAEHANGGKCIIFTQTKRDASGLAYAMGKRNYKCEPLHGDISQNQRERTLEGFRTGRFNILVATDVAARGLDVPNVDLVIHYELPNSSEIFVHRSGRTGRAGKKGTAILIYSPDQTRSVRVLERDVSCRFEELSRIPVDGGDREIMADMRAGGQFGSAYGSGGMGRFGNAGYGRSGSYGSYGSGGRSGSYSGSGFGRSGGTGSSFSRGGAGGFGSYGSPSGRSAGGSGGFGRADGGFGRADSGFGSFGKSERSSGFGSPSSGRPSGFGNAGTSQRSSNFGGSRSNRYGGFGDE